jgi:TldD protein
LPRIEEIAAELSGTLSSYGADYIEVHLEDSRSSQVSYRGRELESVGMSEAAGGNVRALFKGGWGFTSFNSFEGLKDRIELAVTQARLAASGKSKLAEVPPIVDMGEAISEDPTEIPLSRKKELLDEYNQAIWEVEGLKTSVIGYGDGRKKKIFLNSEGSHIEQERADITLRLSAVAARNGDVQQAGLSLGSRGHFSAILGLHKQAAGVAKKAMDLLKAPQAEGGEYPVVLDPVLAGVFVHEAFGHLSESDFVYENERMRELMTLGKRFGSKELNIIDSGLEPGLRGSYKYDDEGTPATKAYLIREGLLAGRLHSRETAGKMGEKPSGNARAISYRYAPIVRMSNTYIEPRDATFEDIICEIKEGIYAKNWYGGTTSMEMFTFSAGEAYMIRDGKIAEALRPVMLSGNVFTTLANIDAIGNDLDFNQGGGCGKGEQSPLPVSNGSPHIRIKKCLVGGA